MLHRAFRSTTIQTPTSPKGLVHRVDAKSALYIPDRLYLARCLETRAAVTEYHLEQDDDQSWIGLLLNDYLHTSKVGAWHQGAKVRSGRRSYRKSLLTNHDPTVLSRNLVLAWPYQ